jgi:prepilin-type N-terminal cleavage/methylation domain-containing protein
MLKIICNFVKKSSKKLNKNHSTPFHKKVYSVITKYIKRKKKTGFTMIELLVVLAIVGMASTVGAVTFNSSLVKSRDAKRKKDISTLKTSFEDYYNDNDCYPPATILDDCGSSDLAPYLNEIPCDPVEKTPYLYVPLADVCDGYQLLTNLENDIDPVISKIGCDGPNDCGFEIGYNYGTSVGASLFGPNYEAPEASPSPGASPSTNPGNLYACDSGGWCNEFQEGNGCPITFESSDCDNACGDPAVRCNI